MYYNELKIAFIFLKHKEKIYGSVYSNMQMKEMTYRACCLKIEEIDDVSSPINKIIN